jgi:hypothetical protein
MPHIEGPVLRGFPDPRLPQEKQGLRSSRLLHVAPCPRDVAHSEWIEGHFLWSCRHWTSFRLYFGTKVANVRYNGTVLEENATLQSERLRGQAPPALLAMFSLLATLALNTRTWKREMKLQHITARLLLLAALLLSSGCPYQSDVPLGAPQDARLDGALVGMWHLRGAEEDSNGTASIYPFNEHEMLIVVQEKGKEKIDVIRAFATTIGHEKFLNVRDVTFSSKESKWRFVNYRVVEDTLHIKVVDDKLITRGFNSSNKLRRFVRKNLDNKELYQDSEGMILQRIN